MLLEREMTLFTCQTNTDNVKIHTKADEKSEIIFVIENADTELNAIRNLDGFIDSERYWYVFVKADEDYRFGYVSEKYIK